MMTRNLMLRLRARGLALLLTLLASTASAQVAGPAEISLRRAGGGDIGTVELGDRIRLEAVVSAGAAEVTGYAFAITYDSDVFRLREPDGSRTGESVVEPFLAGDWLGGVALLNRVEVEEGKTYLVYAEAAGVQRQSASGTGVVASFILEAVRRPLGDRSTIEVVASGHERTAHYVTADQPGIEQAFGAPLGRAVPRITGFQIQSLPDLVVVEGDGAQSVIDDLSVYVDQEGAQVIWTASFVEGLGTSIDIDNAVTMDPRNTHGDTVVVFTAFEVNEGNADADTVRVRVLARPRITGLPPVITFVEDGESTPLNLDDVVTDLDSPDAQLTWSATNGSFIHVDIDAATRLAVFHADPDASGEGEVRLVVSDVDGLTDTVTTRVVVSAVNDPPVVQRRAPVYPRLGDGGAVVLPLAELVADPDDAADSLQVLLQTEGGITAQLTADGSGVEITGTATGRGIVRLTVQDRAGERDEGRVVAVVLPEGATLGPEISPLPLLRFLNGSVGTLDLTSRVTDDGPIADLGWTPISIASLRPVVRDGVLVVTAGTGYTGNTAIGLVVTDADGNQDAASLAVEVLPAGEAQPPQIVAPPKIGLASGPLLDGAATEVQIDLDAWVDDPDDNDDTITWTVTASSGLTAEFDADTRQVRLTAAPGLNEIGALTLTATDRDGLSDTRSIPVLVVEPGGAPLIDELEDVILDSTGAEGRVDLDDEVFDDEDFESELAWSAMGEPGIEVGLDPATHLLRVRRDETGAQQPPSEARVVLTARDTRGQERSAIVTVQLPPVFQLEPIPDLVIYAGDSDSSLVLADYVVDGAGTPLQWSLSPPAQLTAEISATTRVRIASPNASFVGTEILRFTATDATGRTRPATVRVSVRGRGLAPQVRTLPVVEVAAGASDRSIDLDDYVVDDDADSTLSWSVSQPADVTVEVDPLTHELTVQPLPVAAGPRTAQLVVRDPAGNSAVALVQIQVLRGGQAPVVGPLPQILLPAGGPEESLSLDLFVADPDTPDEQINWTVSVQPGVAARISQRRLLVSIPASQKGSRQVLLIATDPQGNRAEGTLIILIQQDDTPPAFALKAQRDLFASDDLTVEIRATEPLNGAPTVTVNGAATDLLPVGTDTWEIAVPVPPVDAVQDLVVDITGRDRAGNEGQRRAEISLRRVSRQGGTVRVDEGRVQLNIPGAVARPGRLAVLYPLAPEDLPEDVGPEPGRVYSLDIAAGAEIDEAMVLNLFVGADASDPTVGMERWNPDMAAWEDVPAASDAGSGWLSAAVGKPGLYRVGEVEPVERRDAAALSNYPNPFNADMGATRIEYEVSTAGPVRLELYNLAGQRVRVLVDEAQLEPGVWTADWDGRDAAGRRLATGIYLYRLQEPGAERVRQLLLLK